MALPSFANVWSSRQCDSSNSKEDPFFLLGGSSSQPNPVFRRSANIQWFDSSYSISRYSCCDRPFDTEKDLQQHKDEHVKCFTPDCEFTAHPDVVEKHFELQHQNNLYRKVCLTNRPEDISKWISDRKRNFPTKARVESKQVDEEKRRNRGEVIEKKSFSLMRGRSGNRHIRGNSRGGSRDGRGRFDPSRGRGRGRGFATRSRGGRGIGRRLSRQVEQRDLRPLTDDPLSCLESREEVEEENDRPMEVSSKCPPQLLPPDLRPPEEEKAGGLSLIADYDSSDEDVAEKKENPVVEEVKTDPRPQPECLPRRDFRRHDPVLRLVRRREMCMEDKRRILSRPQLLEMLLARDIQHERNVLMQCCYFIVKRNFFGRRPRQVNEPTEPKSKASPEASVTKMNRHTDEEWDGDGIL